MAQAVVMVAQPYRQHVGLMRAETGLRRAHHARCGGDAATAAAERRGAPHGVSAHRLLGAHVCSLTQHFASLRISPLCTFSTQTMSANIG